MQISDLAYSKTVTEQAAKYHIRCENLRIFEHESSRAIVFESRIPHPSGERDGVVISFRGTANLEDTLLDLKSAKSVEALAHNGDQIGTAAEGFYIAYDRMRSVGVLDEALERARLPRNGGLIFVTGHSLGGAMATICAADLHQSYQEKDNLTIRVATYGSPRAFTNETSRVIESFGKVHL